MLCLMFAVLLFPQVGLVRYLVVALEDPAVAERAHFRARQAAALLKRASEIASGRGKRRRVRQGKRAAKRARKPEGAGEMDEAISDPSSHDEEESEDSLDRHVASTDEEDASESDSTCEEEHPADHPPLPPPAAPPQPPAPPPPPAGVWLDRATGRLWDAAPGIAGRMEIGRISYPHAETNKAAVSVYCRLHGCTEMKRVARSPAQALIVNWFAEGLSLGRGRTPQLRAQHKGKFPQPT